MYKCISPETVCRIAGAPGWRDTSKRPERELGGTRVRAARVEERNREMTRDLQSLSPASAPALQRCALGFFPACLSPLGDTSLRGVLSGFYDPLITIFHNVRLLAHWHDVADLRQSGVVRSALLSPPPRVRVAALALLAAESSRRPRTPRFSCSSRLTLLSQSTTVHPAVLL
jgi:hypothetical protein